MAALDDALLPGERVLYRPLMGVRMYALLALMPMLAAGGFLWLSGVAAGMSVGDIVWFFIVMLFPGMAYIDDNAILTDRRLLYSGPFREVALENVAGIDAVGVMGGQLVVTDTAGTRHRMPFALNLQQFADAIVLQTAVTAPPVLTGKIRAWNILYQGMIVAAFFGGLWVFAEVHTQIADTSIGLAALVDADSGFPKVALTVLGLVVGVATGMLMAAVGALAAAILGSVILRVGLDSREARALFARLVMPARLRGKKAAVTFHYRWARGFASVLYGERI